MSSPPRHHLPESTLLEYAAGTLSEGVGVLVGTHLALCPPCRERSQAYDAIGGEILAEAKRPVLDPSVLDGLLQKLDAVDTHRPTPVPVRYDGVIPMPLRRYTGPFDDIRWTFVAPGIWKLPLSIESLGRHGALVHLRGGVRIPNHQHLGVERTLVLTGGFTDERSQFVRGDLCIRDPDDSIHAQVIDRGEPCIALALDDAGKQPTTLMGRTLNRLFED